MLYVLNNNQNKLCKIIILLDQDEIIHVAAGIIVLGLEVEDYTLIQDLDQEVTVHQDLETNHAHVHKLDLDTRVHPVLLLIGAEVAIPVHGQDPNGDAV